MPAETIEAGAQISINGVQRVKLSNAGAKPADVEITDDGTHINRRIDAGGDVTEELHGNPVTITNKSKFAVLAEW